MMTSKTAADRYGHDLWAITCYFNPAGYRRKLANYRLFRQHLVIPLVAVEMGYGHDFELTNDDPDIMVQLRGGDVLWQKERLLNLALQVDIFSAVFGAEPGLSRKSSKLPGKVGADDDIAGGGILDCLHITHCDLAVTVDQPDTKLHGVQ